MAEGPYPAEVMNNMRSKATAPTFSDRAYEQIKADIFAFRLLPGERFSENELAARLGVSRTPVREALLRLAREGYIEVSPKSGWNVRQLDFEQIEEFYDVRTVLELAAVRRLCEMSDDADLESLKAIWLVPSGQRLSDWQRVAELDEAFHEGLLEAAGNREMARIHREVTERIRVVRRLDFTKGERVDYTYEEHARILRAIMQRRLDHAQLLLRTHIESSKQEVRKLTLHMLHTARSRMAEEAPR